MIDILEIENTDKVIFGVTVTLINTEDDSGVTYKLVGEVEASINVGKISTTSPVARGMISRDEGEVVAVAILSGKIEYEIGEVQHL